MIKRKKKKIVLSLQTQEDKYRYPRRERLELGVRPLLAAGALLFGRSGFWGVAVTETNPTSINGQRHKTDKIHALRAVLVYLFSC